MANNSASVRLTVAQRQALAALNQFQSKFAAMTKSMSANTKRTANAASGTNKTLNSWGRNIKTAALSMVGFGSATGAAYTVVSLIKNELNVIDETLDRMKDRQLDFAQATMKVAFALPNKDGKLIDMDIDELSERFSKGTHDPAQAMRVFQHIHGANADLSLSGKAEVTETLMKKRFDLNEDEMKLAGVQAADNHAKALARGYKSSIEAQVGLFEGTKAASKVTDDGAFYGNIAPIGLDLSKFDVNQGEALFAAAALSSAANDKEGTETRTALSKFFAQLEEMKAKYGIEESGFELTRALREGKTDKHRSMQKEMLGVFADGEDENFLEMSSKEASMKLEGRSKLKFYLMDWIRKQGEDDPNNLRNVMKVIKGSGQIPLSFKGDTFEVDMDKTLDKSAEYFADKIDQATKNKYVKLFTEKNKGDTANASLEMANTAGARQKMRRDAAIRMMENAGVPMAKFRGKLDFYMDKYGDDEGMLRAARIAKRSVIFKHPEFGRGERRLSMSNGLHMPIAEEIFGNVEKWDDESIKNLKYHRKGWLYNYDEHGISEQQLNQLAAIKELTDAIKEDRLRKIEGKVEVTNAGALNESTGAARLGE